MFPGPAGGAGRFSQVCDPTTCSYTVTPSTWPGLTHHLQVVLLRGFMEAAQEEGEADRIRIMQVTIGLQCFFGNISAPLHFRTSTFSHLCTSPLHLPAPHPAPLHCRISAPTSCTSSTCPLHLYLSPAPVPISCTYRVVFLTSYECMGNCYYFDGFRTDHLILRLCSRPSI